jgi:hypothetical protein
MKTCPKAAVPRTASAGRESRGREIEKRRKSQNPIFLARLSFRRRAKKSYRLSNKLLFVVRKRLRTMEEWHAPKCGDRRHASQIWELLWELRSHLTIATGVSAFLAARPRVANKVNLASGRGKAGRRHARSVIPGGKTFPGGKT